MTQKTDVEALAALARQGLGHEAPSATRMVTEVRSEGKYMMAHQPHLPDHPALVVVWRYGIPKDKMNTFNSRLRTDEQRIATALPAKPATAVTTPENNVVYLGTYLNVDAGTPMYETRWGYMRITDNSIDKTIDSVDWSKVLGAPAAATTLRSIVEFIRDTWGADPGRSEQRYALAGTHSVVDRFLGPTQNP